MAWDDDERLTLFGVEVGTGRLATKKRNYCFWRAARAHAREMNAA